MKLINIAGIIDSLTVPSRRFYWVQRSINGHEYNGHQRVIPRINDDCSPDPPSVERVPESGKLEVNLGEEVDMACVAKGVPVPVVTWMNKVINILLVALGRD